MSLKTRIYRNWIYIKNRFKEFSPRSVYDINDFQELGIKIFEKSLKSPDSVLIYYPLTRTNYIRLNNIEIILENSTLKIIKGDYFYNINLPDKCCSDLDFNFFKYLEKKRIKDEEKISVNMKHSLNLLLEDISKKL